MKKMSARQTRIARAWMIHYNRIFSKPAKAVIVFGQGMNKAHWMDNAEGFVKDFGSYATIH